MIEKNNNKSQSKTSKVLKQHNITDVQLSVQECNEWIKNNPDKIVNLYLQFVLEQKKKPIQSTLNNLVKNERENNTSKFMSETSLNVLKDLTQKNQMLFGDWKHKSKLTSSKIRSFTKNVEPIQIESIDQFLKRGGVIKTVKNRKMKSI
ncbi:MAG: hypothetical protein JNM24_06775 [Bdellovibrionaceae bacterium]|nr:hypothetical protein [Pseudobdellovibrionaceae bacterium]